METFLALVVAAVVVPLVLLGIILVAALIWFILPLIIDPGPDKSAGNRASASRGDSRPLPGSPGNRDQPAGRAQAARTAFGNKEISSAAELE
jgi:hypothetical protein